MTEYSKYNVIYRLQKWLDSVPGQTFLNYAYSWGASIVILGTLFKLTHLPGANVMLYLGMGTEVVVFFISAFDRPFDKTEEGRDLPTHVVDEEVLDDATPNVAQTAQPVNGVAGGTIIIGGGVPKQSTEQVLAASSNEQKDDNVEQEAVASMQPNNVSAATVPPTTMGGTPVWVEQQQNVSPEMEEATKNYVEELNNLTEMLAKVSEQSQRLTRDSEEMENLNRTLTGICKVYEMQLKGASAQIGTIDQINEQSRRMAEQIGELNKIYARMIEAMTVNMRATSPLAGNSEQHS